VLSIVHLKFALSSNAALIQPQKVLKSRWVCLKVTKLSLKIRLRNICRSTKIPPTKIKFTMLTSHFTKITKR
jgi:hypothetical protein